jgi:DNA-binding PadR family transcriptional regulator
MRKRLNGQCHVLLLASSICAEENKEFKISKIKDIWRKPKTGSAFAGNFLYRAEEAGWIEPVHGKQGIFRITEEGQNKLLELVGVEAAGSVGVFAAGALRIFDGTSTHSFDKYFRLILRAAKKEVLIADAYVDEKVFDNLLDETPKNTAIKLIFENQSGTFKSRLARFKTEYICEARLHPIHDRWAVVDGKGYVIGPSLKNAADKKPATVVELGVAESATLSQFFNKMWNNSK